VSAPAAGDTEGGTRERRGLFALIADIPRLLRELIEAEITSMKDEIVGKMKAAGIGAGFLVGAGALAFFAALALTAAGILALALVLPAWAAALIVAAALLVLAGLAAAIGVYQLKRGVPPTPTETIESVKTDVRVVRGLRKRGAS
jgi:hypothetical protein